MQNEISTIKVPMKNGDTLTVTASARPVRLNEFGLNTRKVMIWATCGKKRMARATLTIYDVYRETYTETDLRDKFEEIVITAGIVYHNSLTELEQTNGKSERLTEDFKVWFKQLGQLEDLGFTIEDINAILEDKN